MVDRGGFLKQKVNTTSRIYLDDYVLQKDMRIRMPKEIIKNLRIKPGESFFEIYLDLERKEIILTVKEV